MLLSATKSHRKNQIELVQNVLHAEEEKRRRERELFHITAVPLLSRASQEPGLFVLGGVTGDDHAERKSCPDCLTLSPSICLSVCQPEICHISFLFGMLRFRDSSKEVAPEVSEIACPVPTHPNPSRNSPS